MYSRRPAASEAGVSALAFNAALAQLAAAVETPRAKPPVRRVWRNLTIATGVAALLAVAARAVTQAIR